MTAHYRPGAAIALVGDDRVLLVPASVDIAAVRAAWDAGSPALLDHFLSGGIAAMPGFACWELHADRLRVILRGEFSAAVAGEEWDAVAAATWIERVLPVPSGEVTLAASGAGAGDGPAWPIARGIVYADTVVASPAGVPTGAGGSRPQAKPEPAPEPPREAKPAPASVPEPAPEPRLVVEPVDLSAEEPAPPEQPAQPGSAAQPAAAEQPAAEAAVTRTEVVDDSFDELFGHTVLRTAEDAAVRLDDARPKISPVPGKTAPAPDEDAEAVRPPAVRLLISDGTEVEMSGPVVVGVAPEARHSTGAVPRLVVVQSPSKAVSRTHLEFALEDGRVVARDVSSNGTLLTRPGAEPQRLPAQQHVLVTDGCELALGDGVVITVVSS